MNCFGFSPNPRSIFLLSSTVNNRCGPPSEGLIDRSAPYDGKIAVDTVINVKVILIGLTSEVKRPPLA